MDNALRAVLCLVNPTSHTQLQTILLFLRDRGLELVGIARTFRAAEDMGRAGEADLIVTDSSRNLPMELLIISREIKIQDWKRSSTHPRPRRLRRTVRRNGGDPEQPPAAAPR